MCEAPRGIESRARDLVFAGGDLPVTGVTMVSLVSAAAAIATTTFFAIVIIAVAPLPVGLLVAFRDLKLLTYLFRTNCTQAKRVP